MDQPSPDLLQLMRIRQLEEENHRLLSELARAHATIERLRSRLGDDEGCAAATDSCIAACSVVRNSRGERLFQLFLDPPTSDAELLSWYTPYLSQLSDNEKAQVRLMVRQTRAPVSIAQVPFLDEVVLTVDDDVATPTSLPSSLLFHAGSQKHPFVDLLCSGLIGILAEVTSYLSLGEVDALGCTCKPLYLALFVHSERAVPVMLGHRFEDDGVAHASVLLYRPCVLGKVFGNAAAESSYRRPLRLLRHVLHHPFSEDCCVSLSEMWQCLRRADSFSSYVRQQLRAFPNGFTPLSSQDALDAALAVSGVSGLRAGMQLDVLDTVRKWYDATILRVDSSDDTVTVHYNHWTNNWDERIHVPRNATVRFAPLGSQFNESVWRSLPTAGLQSTVGFFLVISSSGRWRDIETLDAAVSGNWMEILDAAFASQPHVKPFFQNGRVDVVVATMQQLRTVMETHLINHFVLERDFFTKAEDLQNSVPSFLSRQITVWGDRQPFTSTFFVLLNLNGRGIVYSRFGSKEWKH